MALPVKLPESLNQAAAPGLFLLYGIESLAQVVAALSVEPCRAAQLGDFSTCRTRGVTPLCLTCEARHRLESLGITLEA